jgi:hypothetical protein
MLATYGRNSVPSLSASNLYYKCMSLLKLISLLISRFVVFCFFFGFCFYCFFFLFFFVFFCIYVRTSSLLVMSSLDCAAFF